MATPRLGGVCELRAAHPRAASGEPVLATWTVFGRRCARRLSLSRGFCGGRPDPDREGREQEQDEASDEYGDEEDGDEHDEADEADEEDEEGEEREDREERQERE